MTTHAAKLVLHRQDVCDRLGISQPTLDRYVRHGILPKPRYLGRAPFWTESEILEVIDNLPRAGAA